VPPALWSAVRGVLVLFDVFPVLGVIIRRIDILSMVLPYVFCPMVLRPMYRVFLKPESARPSYQFHRKDRAPSRCPSGKSTTLAPALPGTARQGRCAAGASAGEKIRGILAVSAACAVRSPSRESPRPTLRTPWPYVVKLTGEAHLDEAFPDFDRISRGVARSPSQCSS
jgi:hypothetical protein